jgi:ABC-type multidrug transport system permease subunit
MGSTMMGRPIVNKHQAFAFHRPAALWVAQIFVDLPFAMTNIMCYSLIAYFSTGLYRSAGVFFTFYLYIVVGYVVMTLFFRSVGVVCPDFDYAMKFAAVIITLFILTSGYLLPYDYIPWWIRWSFWLKHSLSLITNSSPVSYGFSSMMDNEFKHVNFTCATANLVPSGPTYTDLSFQVCTLPGSVTGTDLVIGSNYISQQYFFYPSQQWRNFGIMLCFGAFFMAINCLLSEVVLWGASGRTVTFFQKENHLRKSLNEELARKKHARKVNKSVQDKQAQQLKITSKKVLTWEGLNYDVPVGGKPLRLLDNIFGYVKPGQ